MKDVKGKNRDIKRRIAEQFVKRKEKQDIDDWNKIYKRLLIYGCVITVLILSGFLIGWFSSSFHHSKSDQQEQTEIEAIETGIECQDGEKRRGHTCLHIQSCSYGSFVETKCPRFHQFDTVTETCTWIHLASCQEESDLVVDNDEESVSNEDSGTDIIGEGVPNLQKVLDTEVRLLMKHGLKRVRNSVRTLENEEVEKVKPGHSNNPDNVKIVESLITSRDWNMFFPIRNQVYSYNSFLQAVAKFPGFCENERICRASLAVIFAHFTQETGAHDRSLGYPEWRQGLYYLEEAGCSDRNCGYSSNCPQETWLTEKWPCGKKKDGSYQNYHGRGAKQISYNYNYGQFSEFMYGNASVLLGNPDIVGNSWLAIVSAIWFFLMPQPPKPSMLQVLDGSWKPNKDDLANGIKPGFGVTTHIINGGVECGKGTELQQSLNRQEYFRHFFAELKVDELELLENPSCADMKEFPSTGSGSETIYWEQDWARKYHCKLVSYATQFSALVPGDYLNCVQAKFNIKIVK